MDDLANYAARRESAVAALALARQERATVGLRKSTSNLFRRRDGAAGKRIDVRRFNHVLNIDRERLLADVEGMTTYEALVDETLKYGTLPKVTPQLKTITAGGAAAGLGIESSSFHHGLVHETVEEMEILTGDARTIVCSPSRSEDLFYGFPNSYGTLGYALRLKIQLMPAKPFVRLAHTRFTAAGEYFRAIQTSCEGGVPDFIDGTAFSPTDMYITTGEFVDEAPFSSDYTYTRIYYKSIPQKGVDYLTAHDYIWRWDTDWFWCSKQFYLQHPVARFLATKRLLNSRTYQRVMRLSHKLMPSSNGSESVIQDVDIPIAKAEHFFYFLFDEIGIAPVWICPFRTSATAYPLYPLHPGELYVNFGFWDVIPSRREPGHFNRKVEQKALELDGKKALYSTSCYDAETFWRIYGKSCYDRLKSKYDPGHIFPDLYAKCVQRV